MYKYLLMKGIKIKYHKTFLVKNGTVFYIWSTPQWWGWFKPKYLYKIHFTEAFHLTWKRSSPPHLSLSWLLLYPVSDTILLFTSLSFFPLSVSTWVGRRLWEWRFSDFLFLSLYYWKTPPKTSIKRKGKHWNMKIRLANWNKLSNRNPPIF